MVTGVSSGLGKTIAESVMDQGHFVVGTLRRPAPLKRLANRKSGPCWRLIFFGSLKVAQSALPMLRRQKSGHLIQISSHGGFKALPGFGVYNASKFALEGASEALAGEIAPLGIRLTIVEPGPFRTAFAGAGRPSFA